MASRWRSTRIANAARSCLCTRIISSSSPSSPSRQSCVLRKSPPSLASLAVRSPAWHFGAAHEAVGVGVPTLQARQPGMGTRQTTTRHRRCGRADRRAVAGANGAPHPAPPRTPARRVDRRRSSRLRRTRPARRTPPRRPSQPWRSCRDAAPESAAMKVRNSSTATEPSPSASAASKRRSASARSSFRSMGKRGRCAPTAVVACTAMASAAAVAKLWRQFMRCIAAPFLSSQPSFTRHRIGSRRTKSVGAETARPQGSGCLMIECSSYYGCAPTLRSARCRAARRRGLRSSLRTCCRGNAFDAAVNTFSRI